MLGGPYGWQDQTWVNCARQTLSLLGYAPGPWLLLLRTIYFFFLVFGWVTPQLTVGIGYVGERKNLFLYLSALNFATWLTLTNGIFSKHWHSRSRKYVHMKRHHRVLPEKHQQAQFMAREWKPFQQGSYYNCQRPELWANKYLLFKLIKYYAGLFPKRNELNQQFTDFNISHQP